MNEADILALTFEDRMTVKRHVETVDEDTGISNFSDVTSVFENIPCALSKKDEANINGDIPSVVSNHKVFARPDVDIKPGDLIEITRLGRIYRFIASKPFYYISHVEVLVESKERI